MNLVSALSYRVVIFVLPSMVLHLAFGPNWAFAFHSTSVGRRTPSEFAIAMYVRYAGVAIRVLLSMYALLFV